MGEEILPRASGRRKERLMGRIGFTMGLDWRRSAGWRAATSWSSRGWIGWHDRQGICSTSSMRSPKLERVSSHWPMLGPTRRRPKRMGILYFTDPPGNTPDCGGLSRAHMGATVWGLRMGVVSHDYMHRGN